MSDQTTAVDTKREMMNWLTGAEMKKQFALALPKHLTADRMTRVALTAFTRTPKLLNCTKESLLKCLMSCSELGIEPDGRRAHLIPYNTECTLVIDYKGLAELAMRSGLVSNLHADVVCDNDAFTYNCGHVDTHIIDFKKPRGPVYAAYAVCTFKDGTKASAVMSRDEIEAIRKRSRAGSNGPWVTDWNEMAKKTAFRRLSKWLPLSPEFRDAVEKDADAIDITGDLIDTGEGAKAAAGLLAAKKADAPAEPAGSHVHARSESLAIIAGAKEPKKTAALAQRNLSADNYTAASAPDEDLAYVAGLLSRAE